MNDAAPSEVVGAIAADDRPGSHRRWLRPLLLIPTPVIFVAAAALAVVLLWRGGALGDIAVSLRGAHPGSLLAIVLAYSFSILLLGLRWHALTRLAGGAPEWVSSAEVFLTSVIVNYAAPIGLAVPTRAALTVRDLGLTPAQSGAVVAWEAALDVLALVLIAAGWLALGGLVLVQTMPLDARFIALAAAVILLAVIALAVIAKSAPLRSRLIPVAARLISAPRREPARATLAALLTVAFWATQSAVMATLLRVFGVAPTLPLVLGVMGLPVLIGMLSPVPGGAGVREALMVAAAGLEGAPAAPVLLAAVAYRLALFAVTPLVWGAVRLAGLMTKRN